MENTYKITVEAHGIRRTVEIPDDSTWYAILNEFVSVITMPGGYNISGKKLEEWAQDWRISND